MKSMHPSRSNISIAVSLLALLVVVYILVYSGRFIIDDEHILASRTISLAFDQQINNERVIGNSRVFALSQLPIAAMNIEPAQAVLGVPLVKIASLLKVGQVQALFLMNIWITAFTALILFWTVILKGYSKVTASIVSLLFGLCTIVFPYSRTYFRDPLAMFFLSCAWMLASAISVQPGGNGNRLKKSFLWVGLFLSLVAGVLTKNTILIAFPVILLELSISIFREGFGTGIKIHFKRSWRTWVLIVAAISACGLIWFLVTPSIASLARFTPAYYRYLAQFFFTTPHPHLLQALSGPFVSPGKSIFAFSPILILSIWSLIYRFRSSWSAWLYLLLLVVFQALFYDMDWSGHINWGLRYVLPAVPLLMVITAPIIQRMITTVKGRVAIVILATISFIVQLLGSLPPISKYFEEMLTATPPVSEYATVWDLKYSILVWSAQWILSGKPLDIALARMENQLVVVLPVALLILVFVFLSLRWNSLRKIVYLAVIANAMLSIGILFVFIQDPIYMKDRSDFVESQQMLTQQYTPGDAVLIKSYGSPIWDYWMNWTDPKILWTSMPYYFPAPALIEKYNNSNIPEDALDKISLDILTLVVQSAKKVWLVIPSDSPGASLGIEKRWLANRSDNETCSEFQSSSGTTELCQYMLK